MDWYSDTFIPTVQQRGAAIIEARGASSAASAANAAVDHMRSWALGTTDDDWVSMGVISDGSYDIEPGLIYSFPCHCRDGQWEIVQGLEISSFSREKMDATAQWKTAERAWISGSPPSGLRAHPQVAGATSSCQGSRSDLAKNHDRRDVCAHRAGLRPRHPATRPR